MLDCDSVNDNCLKYIIFFDIQSTSFEDIDYQSLKDSFCY